MPEIDPPLRRIIDQEQQEHAKNVEAERAARQMEAPRREAYFTWTKLFNYRGDAIADNVSDEACRAERIRLIVELGHVLAKINRIHDTLTRIPVDSTAKEYALAILRKAVEGDATAVAALDKELYTSPMPFHLGVMLWLRERLMYEVLNILREPEPPDGWEGEYVEQVDTVDDFIRWIDRELSVWNILDTHGNDDSDGHLVRNAYRLVDKLDVRGLPPEPTGDFKLNDELVCLRNLRRLLLEKRESAERAEDGSRDAADALPTGKVPGVISLNVLASHLTMRGHSEWDKRRQSWTGVPELQLFCEQLFHGQPFNNDTIELLIAWFQRRGLSPAQARHLPLGEAVRRLQALLLANDAPPPLTREQAEGGGAPATRAERGKARRKASLETFRR